MRGRKFNKEFFYFHKEQHQDLIKKIILRKRRIHFNTTVANVKELERYHTQDLTKGFQLEGGQGDHW